MAVIPIRDVPGGPVEPAADNLILIDDGAGMHPAVLEDAVKIGRPAASQEEAEAGVDNEKVMTPLRVLQAIAVQGGAAYAPASAAVPSGGDTGEVLVKASNTNFDTMWMLVEEATAVSYGPQSLDAGQQAQARENIAAVGNLHKVTVIASSGTHVYDEASTLAIVHVIGGGGAGGGATNSGTTHAAAGGGGGEAGKAIKLIDLDGIDDAAITIGAGGTGLAGSGGNGGGASVYSDGVNTLTANGGAGASGGASAASITLTAGGVGGTATGGDVNLTGEGGSNAVASGSTDASIPVASAGKGGGGPAGATLRGAGSDVFNGTTATRPGAGGSGAGRIATASGTATGGNGAAGRVIIWEYR